MIDSTETDCEGVPFSIAFAHVEQDFELHRGLSILVREYDLLGWMVQEILALVPDRTLWRLTLTGDIAVTVNEIKGRDNGSSYTVDRGAGHVGGITLPKADGTFDIVIGVENLVNPFGEYAGLEGLVANAIATGRHLGRHEAGHAALSIRRESDKDYRDLPELDPTAAGWTHAVAPFIDDFRIERHVRDHTPPVMSHMEGLNDAIDHLSSELSTANVSWKLDFEEAANRSDIAIAGFVRVISYLAAELGLDDHGEPVLPESTPPNWDRYLGTAWPLWSAAFHRLHPVDEPMTAEELSEVLSELCELVVNWSAAIGYERGLTGDGRAYAFWTEETY